MFGVRASNVVCLYTWRYDKRATLRLFGHELLVPYNMFFAPASACAFACLFFTPNSRGSHAAVTTRCQQNNLISK